MEFIQGNLFEASGNPMFIITPVKRAKYHKNGYASVPGSGPPGETCGSCAFVRKRMRFHKCKLMCHRWTNSYGTDVLLKSPACRKWEKK